MGIFASHTFLTSASFAASGSPLSVPGIVRPNATMDISISGSRASNTLLFEGKGDIGGYSAIKATNRASGTSASQTTATVDELWTIPIAGLRYVNVRPSAISGSVTAIGIVVG